jgi:hypothetical protein
VWRPNASGGDDRGEVAFHVGGGITWSSDAEAEDRETLAKGAALARALGVDSLEPDEERPTSAGPLVPPTSGGAGPSEVARP